MKLVLDASAALALAVEDEPLHERALARLEEWSRHEISLCAPPLFESETDSALRRRVHLKTMSAAKAREARRLIALLRLEIVQSSETRELAYAIAERFDQIRVYDSTYAALAQVLGLELWTADERFFNSVHGSHLKTPLSWVRFIGEETKATNPD